MQVSGHSFTKTNLTKTLTSLVEASVIRIVVSVSVILISSMGNGGGAGVSIVSQWSLLAGPLLSFQNTFTCENIYVYIWWLVSYFSFKQNPSAESYNFPCTLSHTLYSLSNTVGMININYCYCSEYLSVYFTIELKEQQAYCYGPILLY